MDLLGNNSSVNESPAKKKVEEAPENSDLKVYPNHERTAEELLPAIRR